MSLQRMFEALEELRSSASVDATFGQPQETHGRTLIPVSSVKVGMGMGFGQALSDEESASSETEPESSPEGGGGGGGAGARPIAMIEVTDDETIVHPIVDETKVGLAALALAGWVTFLLLVTIRAILAPGDDDQ